MRALEQRNILGTGLAVPVDRHLQLHKERLSKIRPIIEARNVNLPTTPRRSTAIQYEQKKHITIENLKLARKIFSIMEGASPIAEMINDTSKTENHPGTLNFRNRLEEAQRIHHQNMRIAARLDTIQAQYKKNDIANSILKSEPKNRNKRSPKGRPKSSQFARELNEVMENERQRTADGYMGESSVGFSKDERMRSPGFRAESRAKSPNFTKKFQFPPDSLANPSMVSNTTQATSQDGNSMASTTKTKFKRPHNVLLEYTKVQNGKVLDVAVIKEPFRDRYAIFGIDIDDGQRYELHLTSEEVTNILDGDILVTSVDNTEVWMALLNKVNLQAVKVFAKLPMTSEEVEFAVNQEAVNRGKVENEDLKMKLSRPSTEKPSSSRPIRKDSQGKPIAKEAVDPTTEMMNPSEAYQKSIEIDEELHLRRPESIPLPTNGSYSTSKFDSRDTSDNYNIPISIVPSLDEGDDALDISKTATVVRVLPIEDAIKDMSVDSIDIEVDIRDSTRPSEPVEGTKPNEVNTKQGNNKKMKNLSVDDAEKKKSPRGSDKVEKGKPSNGQSAARKPNQNPVTDALNATKKHQSPRSNGTKPKKLSVTPSIAAKEASTTVVSEVVEQVPSRPITSPSNKKVSTDDLQVLQNLVSVAIDEAMVRLSPSI